MSLTNSWCEDDRNRYLLCLLWIVVVAVWVRLFGLTRESLWVDEIISLDLTGAPGLKTLPLIADLIHPPLYFLGLAQWRDVFGGSEWAIRAFSVVWGVLGVLAIQGYAREVGETRRIALWAAILATLSPLAVYFGQEARMYAQAVALVALSSWALLAWVNRSREGRRWHLWALTYSVSVAALLLTHYVAVVIPLSQGFAVFGLFLVRRNGRFLVGYIFSAVTVVALFLPWFWYVRGLRPSLYRAADLAWIPSPGWEDVVLLYTRSLVWGSPGWGGVGWLFAEGISVVAMGAVGWSLWSGPSLPHGVNRGPTRRLGQWYSIWMMIVPVAVALIISWVYHPVLWYPRFCTLVLPPAIVLAACAIDAGRRRILGTVLAVSLVLIAATGLFFQHQSLTKGGMRNFAKFWALEGPPDVVYFFPEWKRRVAAYEIGPSLPQNHRQRMEERRSKGVAYTIWVCSTTNYDSIWRPDWERTEREWILSFGPQRFLGTYDRINVVEVRVVQDGS